MKTIIPLIAALLLTPLAALAAASPANPNIIFILADDMGWGDLACNGHPYAKTPNLDKLAAQGTRFQQFYATGVTCCPSRTGFMTSWLPARYPVYPAQGGFAERITITELLKKNGYSTGHFGKWHIGPNSQPGTYGIDTVGADDGEESGEASTGGKRKKQPSDSTRGRDAHVFDQALAFIEKNKIGPFYVNIWDHIPHHPVNPSAAELAAFGPLQVDESKFGAAMREKFALCKKLGGDVSEHMRAWLAEIRTMDAEIGTLMQRLDQLGLSNNTIVVFSSDQGPEGIRDTLATAPSVQKVKKAEKKGKPPETGVNPIRLNAMGYAGPSLRGGKHGPYEGGVRIPFIVRWPGHIPVGRVDEKSVLSATDWLPTLCALTGTKINVADFDGEDTTAAWLGQSAHVRTKPLLWKTSAPNSPGSIRIGDWKLHDQRRGEAELYNVVADPGELTNLANKEPAKMKALSAKLNTWVASLPKTTSKADETDK